MNDPKVSNQNDFKVVSFHNSTDFDFTPEMGCMFDGRAINGVSGTIGIAKGEKMTLPYHIGHRIAINLAKAVMTRSAPTVDPAGIPTGVPIWDEVKLEALKNSFITDLYADAKPVAMTETDKLMAKVEELRKFVEQNVQTNTPEITEVESTEKVASQQGVYLDKQDVIAELEKRGIPHDKRSKKDELEKLLA